MKYSNVVWDWNGTLLDDMAACIDAMNRILKEKGLACISGLDEYRSKFCFPVEKYYERLGFDLINDPFEVLARMYIENYAIEYRKAKLFNDARGVLTQLKRSRIMQYVISASEQSSLLDQMKPFEIGHFFTRIIGSDNYYAISKVDIARQWFLNTRAESAKTIFIGDSVHDFEVAEAIGCACILIASGHQSVHELKKTKATIVENIAEAVGHILQG